MFVPVSGWCHGTITSQIRMNGHFKSAAETKHGGNQNTRNRGIEQQKI